MEKTDKQPNEAEEGAVTEQDNKIKDNKKEKTENQPNETKEGKVT